MLVRVQCQLAPLSPRIFEMPIKPSRRNRFTWKDEDVTMVFPQQQQTVLSEELHTILWSLEHVANKQGLSDVMENVVNYLIEHPHDQPLIDEAVRRAEQRVEHAT